MKLFKSILFVLVMLNAACTSRHANKVGISDNELLVNKEVISDNELSDTGWQLTMINGIEVVPESYMKGVPDLFFTEDGKLSGSTGCNQFSGSYKLVGQKLLVVVAAMSKMACPGTGEDEFLSGLSQTVGGSIQNGELHLKDESGNEHMIFRHVEFPKSE